MSTHPSSVLPVSPRTARQSGVSVKRLFTKPGVDPLSEVTWERRRAEIKGADGKIISGMDDVEVPVGWSQVALDIAADKYFRKAGVHGRGYEWSVRQMVARVVKAVVESGLRQGGYFSTREDAETFGAELTSLLVTQRMAFNSPVWFNLGLKEAYGITGRGIGNWHWDSASGSIAETIDSYTQPAISACFIVSIKDDLIAIARHVETEMRIFRFGGGAGASYSTLRGENETLSNGGSSSGMLSFIEVFDKAAGAIKSGGTTRRAARMVVVHADHPDIEKFIMWKALEEDKAKALIQAGYSSDFNGEAYKTVAGQHGNNSVRLTDEFMKAVVSGGEWSTRFRTTGEVAKVYKARSLFRKIAEAAWRCADPGVQYDTTINDWHTIPAAGRIESSNPCCTVGETLVDTSEGLVEIQKLEAMSRTGEMLPRAFSFDLEQNMPVLKQIKRAWVAGETRELIDVVTDKGVVVRCTPDHRFLLRNGDYVEAKDLKVGVRLRKIGRAINHNRQDRRHINHRTSERFPGGTEWMNRFVWEQVNGKIPDGWHVHHKNEDRTDDRISNLELREGSEHVSEHSSGDSNPRFIDTDEALLVEVWEAIEQRGEDRRIAHDRARDLKAEAMSFSMIAKRLTAEGIVPPYADAWSAATVHAMLRVGHDAMRQKVTAGKWNAYVRKNGLQGVVPLANVVKGIRGMSMEEFAEWIDERRCVVNDKVASVSRVTLDVPVKVYDIEVDGVHNFGVRSAGADGVHSVVIHNSEYLSICDSACNLASLNIAKFLTRDGSGQWHLDVPAFSHAARLTFMAQEILVDHASYPTKEIAQNTHDFRQIGLGYASLGSAIMLMGLPYDSERARGFAAGVTALLTGVGYKTSAEIAASKGPFPGFAHNRAPMLGVMNKHRDAAYRLKTDRVGVGLLEAAQGSWTDAVRLGEAHGYRNSQATVIAPAGTIGLLMDCATTGIEPDFALVKSKKLAGGGFMKIVNQSVPAALEALGYSEPDRARILRHIEENATIEGSGVKDEHLSVFDCASRCGRGTRSIAPIAHVTMLEAVQPFVSGAVSKTVNCPKETTVDEIEALYMEAWKRGLKCVAIYRDESKHAQVLSSGGGSKSKTDKADVASVVQKAVAATPPVSLQKVDIDADDAPVTIERPDHDDDNERSGLAPPKTQRRRLPKKRDNGETWELKVGGQKVYLRSNEYADGSVGEVFVDMHKDGATLRSLMNCFSIAISLGLQHGVPLEEFVTAFTFQKFEPAGAVDHPHIKRAMSVVDAIFRVLACEYMGKDAFEQYAQQQPTPEELEDMRARKAIKLMLAQARSKKTSVKVAGVVVPQNGNGNGSASTAPQNGNGHKTASFKRPVMSDGQTCSRCGGLTQRSGTCHTCISCGQTSGCS